MNTHSTSLQKESLVPSLLSLVEACLFRTLSSYQRPPCTCGYEVPGIILL